MREKGGKPLMRGPFREIAPEDFPAYLAEWKRKVEEKQAIRAARKARKGAKEGE